jgi:hypothetical protein
MSTIQPISVHAPANSADVSKHKVIARWGSYPQLFEHGFLAAPVLFLSLYAKLKPYALTHTEAMFALQLMSFKWTDAAPFPSYKTLAQRMGTSDKMVRRYAKALEEKGYLTREARIGTTNAFNLSGLFAALVATAQAERMTMAA